jgi:hypothetical protein
LPINLSGPTCGDGDFTVVFARAMLPCLARQCCKTWPVPLCEQAQLTGQWLVAGVGREHSDPSISCDPQQLSFRRTRHGHCERGLFSQLRQENNKGRGGPLASSQPSPRLCPDEGDHGQALPQGVKRWRALAQPEPQRSLVNLLHPGALGILAIFLYRINLDI